MHVGPRNPDTVGPVEFLADGLVRQKYGDGYIYQVTVKRGDPLDTMQAALAPIEPAHRSKAVVMNVHSPWDVGHISDESLYLSLWVGNTE
jgi:hypothetical protein